MTMGSSKTAGAQPAAKTTADKDKAAHAAPKGAKLETKGTDDAARKAAGHMLPGDPADKAPLPPTNPPPQMPAGVVTDDTPAAGKV